MKSIPNPLGGHSLVKEKSYKHFFYLQIISSMLRDKTVISMLSSQIAIYYMRSL